MDPQPSPNTQRWRRMTLRLRERFQWAAKGVVLWLVQRPSLRWLPLPYPSVATPEAWLEQAQKQVKDKVQSFRHVDKAWRQWKFNLKNLGDCAYLRQRLGLRVSFIEDPLVEGMVMGMAAKGLNTKIRKAVQEEAQAQAKKLSSDAKREEEARTLIGPRGGLPSLRSDLLRLAALLHVPIEDSDTVEKLKEKVKPMIAILKEKSPPLTAVKSAAKNKGARPKSSPKESSATSMSSEHRPLSALQEEMRKMATQMQKLQKQIEERQDPQVLDLTMTDVKEEEDPWDNISEGEKEAIHQSLNDAYAQSLMAQYGDYIEDLTEDQKAIVLDP